MAAAQIAYWDTYVDTWIGPDAPAIPIGPFPMLTTPLLLPQSWFNGAVSAKDAEYNVGGRRPIHEKGPGVLVGFVLPSLEFDAVSSNIDPNTWLCVYAKIITQKRQKANPYKKGPRPQAPSPYRIQLRAKKLTYHHEDILPAHTWPKRDNSLIAEHELISLTWYGSLTRNQRITQISARMRNWDEDATELNREHINFLRVHSSVGPLPTLPV